MNACHVNAPRDSRVSLYTKGRRRGSVRIFLKIFDFLAVGFRGSRSCLGGMTLRSPRSLTSPGATVTSRKDRR